MEFSLLLMYFSLLSLLQTRLKISSAICCLDIGLYSQLRKHPYDITFAHYSNYH